MNLRRFPKVVGRVATVAGSAAVPVAILLPLAVPAAAQAAPDAGDDLRVVSVDVSGEQSLRAVVAVPPSFDQVQLRPESFAVSVDGSTVPTRISRDVQPVDVVVAIDVSGSMKGDPLASAQVSANQFVDRIPAGGRVAVVAFSDDARVVTPMTGDRSAARLGVGSLAAHGETAVYDGLRTAAGLFDNSDHRRALVLLSDGRDTASAATAADAAAALTGSGADFYAIALNTSDTDLSSLDSLVRGVGGSLIGATDAASLAKAYDEAAVRISNRYLIDITSTARGAVRFAVSVAQDGHLATATTTADLTAAGTAPVEEAAKTSTAHAVVATTSWLDSAGLWLGAGALALGIAGLVLFFGGSDTPRRRLAPELGSRRPGSSFSFGEAHQRLVVTAEQLLDRSEKRAWMDAALEEASVDMRPAEFVVLVGGIGGVIALLAFVASGIFAALFVMAFTLVAARIWLSFRADGRRRRFLDGLDGALMTMAGSLRAGQGLPQAIDSVARETEGPISEEFGRVVVENRLGRDIVDSLQGVERRVGGGDFSWVVKAISIQRELGGDLAEVLDNVAATIRDRNRVRAQVRALSAEGRFSAIVLFSLPIVTVGAVSLFSPDYLSSMTENALGWFIISLTVAAMVLGGLWMRKIVRIRF
jgi:tight adherence protein B